MVNIPEGKIMLDPRQVAYDAVDEMMKIGLKKHQEHGWRIEPQNNHIGKGIRHGITHQLIKEGNQPLDGEMHLKNAICRFTMALVQEIENDNL